MRSTLFTYFCCEKSREERLSFFISNYFFFLQVSLEADKVKNVTPRYAKLRADPNGSAKGQIIGWQNIELISDRPLETMLKEFKQLKEEYPDRILIASIMEEYNKAAWEELIYRCEETGIVSIWDLMDKILFCIIVVLSY